MSEVEVKNLKTVKPFLAPEEVPESVVTDPSRIEGLPKKYVPRWRHKDKMASGRAGIWVAIDKTHPDFKNVKVSRDDTPSSTFITRGDLIACVTHRDTYKESLKRKQQRTKLALSNFDKKDKANLERISKEGVDSLKTVLKEEE